LCERVLSAWTKVGEGRIEAAGVELALLNAPPPFSGVYLYQHAMALDLAGQNEAAREAYADAAQSGLYLPPAAVRHADLLVRMGAREDALAMLREVSTQSANAEIDAAAARIAAGASLGLAPLTPARGAAIGLYGLGALYLRDTDTVGGLAAFTLALMLDARFDAARMAFAETQFRLEHYEDARAALAGISADSPYAANAAMSEAWALIDQGASDEAVARAEAGAAGGSPRSLRALGEIYGRAGRYAEAVALYDRLIASVGADADWRLFFARGAAHHQLDDWDGRIFLGRSRRAAERRPGADPEGRRLAAQQRRHHR
jgi:tetratricopeptide (TPR) repeat protein